MINSFPLLQDALYVDVGLGFMLTFDNLVWLKFQFIGWNNQLANSLYDVQHLWFERSWINFDFGTQMIFIDVHVGGSYTISNISIYWCWCFQ